MRCKLLSENVTNLIELGFIAETNPRLELDLELGKSKEFKSICSIPISGSSIDTVVGGRMFLLHEVHPELWVYFIDNAAAPAGIRWYSYPTTLPHCPGKLSPKLDIGAMHVSCE